MMTLQTKADKFNADHPIGSKITIRYNDGTETKHRLGGPAFVSVQNTVLASFTSTFNGQYDRGSVAGVPITVLFNINGVKK